MYASASSNWISAAWLLERKWPDRYGQRRAGSWSEADIAGVVAELVGMFSVYVPDEQRGDRRENNS